MPQTNFTKPLRYDAGLLVNLHADQGTPLTLPRAYPCQLRLAASVAPSQPTCVKPYQNWTQPRNPSRLKLIHPSSPVTLLVPFLAVLLGWGCWLPGPACPFAPVVHDPGAKVTRAERRRWTARQGTRPPDLVGGLTAEVDVRCRYPIKVTSVVR